LVAFEEDPQESMTTSYQKEATMRLRWCKKRQGRGRPVLFCFDPIAELKLRANYAQRWLTKEISITKIADETGRPRWWVREWVRAGCPLFDLLADHEDE
jgi:hypothetical protein